MTAPRFTRLQKATALLPLALLSAAWTANVAGMGGTPLAVAGEQRIRPLPDGSPVPTEAIEAPASVSPPAGVSPGLLDADDQRVVATASASAIPSVALAAYQRAETVINAADTTCRLSWQLVAAIGRVESNHGRYAGSTLTDDGVATPGILGLRLDGTRGTSRIVDTDAGQLDGDTAFDRAVGPMQFIPSTWSVVGVDADGDGRRDPQDIDDAALATAVYLCSGEDDLSTTAGQRAAVYRYNHSQSYVDLVLSIMDGYTAGDFTSIPNNTEAGSTILSDPGPDLGGGSGSPSGSGDGPRGVGTAGPGGSTPSSGPGDPNVPAQPGGGGGGGLPGIGLPPAPTGAAPVDDVLTLDEARVQCTLDGFVDDPASSDDRFDRCVEAYTS